MNIIQDSARKIQGIMEKTVIGQKEVIEKILAGLFAGGHMLLEDVPGVGKTLLAKSLAVAIGAPFSRIQCTPDLLPSDVTGTNIFDQRTGEFSFRQGPLFNPLVLVDEINRAIPRTQSALLEAMAEGQVSMDGETRKLATPFFIIATQNPVETHGTFPLPEAQLDRFLMKVQLGYPAFEEERQIFRLSRKEVDHEASLSEVVNLADVISAQQATKKIRITADVERYLLDLVRATREHEEIRLGVSPRGTIALGSAAQALAGIRGRDYVIPDDIKTLAPSVLSHRLELTSSIRLIEKSKEDLIQEIVEQLPVPVENDIAVETTKR
ncbi:AAA family ATPase [Marininema halotolerans]|uniref:MoxR-like ATPase n=1 Tax=Marininema halotolerans TaxID=1155944 RepID=A0A1I6P7Y5_9BACL|nr:MoxR family ATPase [Marininema halotolerans]SFS36302.1 MoxR-like ATPase [Marininema halotolerans]